ncbi:oocyte zinc finger protein XlCOF6-like [Sceloporus undulatus]|uniref:oocyte zinc finger protein XlCOF6-like n=1 Tax=Sceloporus undulatus TaxID=8520 RepID=UPI001C4CF182|nr:oocyte zinc finger protein XlCOF6-like [Sceloporus undulatus]
MDDEKPNCSNTFPEGSKKTGGFSQADFEEINSTSDWSSLEEEERRQWIETERENDDTESSLSGTHCTDWKDEELSYDADCSESEDEGKVCKLKYKGTEHGKLTGTFQNQDVPKREDGNNTKKKRDKSTVCLDKIFSQQKQGKPNGENESHDANFTMQRDEKPHKASECGKSYIYKRSLKEHKQSHLKERSYKCAECGK